jgi:hypothetical protein
MESEPKKPMEQMLEALAKARREQFGDDAKMPNPMRARLHDEIAQAGTVKDENVESRPSWITMFWPRLTVAAALATLLVLVPAIWWNQSHPGAESGHLVLRDRNAAASEALNPAVPAKDALANASAMSATGPTVKVADNSQIKVEPAAASEAEAWKSSTYFAQGSPAAEPPSQATNGVIDKKIASAKIQATPGAVPPVSQPSSAGGLATTQQSSQRSAGQSFRNNAQVSVGANVLNTFQVQQEGNEIRVLDADGSTYTGKIEQSVKGAELDSRIAAQREVAKDTPRYAAKAVGENKPASPQSYFRATGYNVSLKKTLVFEGSYAAPAPQQPTTATTNDRQRPEQIRQRARIFGIVLVNGEAPVEVDAIAFTPEATETKKNEK